MEKRIFSTNGSGATGHPCAKKKKKNQDLDVIPFLNYLKKDHRPT